MNAQVLRDKDIQQLQDELMQLRKEQFNLRMQVANSTTKTHEKKQIRRTIARIKTILTEKGTRV